LPKYKTNEFNPPSRKASADAKSRFNSSVLAPFLSPELALGFIPFDFVDLITINKFVIAAKISLICRPTPKFCISWSSEAKTILPF